MNLARAFAVLSIPAAVVLAGCETASTTAVYTPVTGIELPAAALVAGHGCGLGDAQVYRVAAVVRYEVDGGPVPPNLTFAVFDCFTDGVFSNLPAMDGGSNFSFWVSVYGMNAATYAQAFGCDAATCATADASDPDTWAALSNWTTTCTGTEISGVTALAGCNPLQPALGSSADAGDGGAAETPDAADAADASDDP